MDARMSFMDHFFIVDYQKIFTHRVKVIEKEEEKPSRKRESE